ncbi:MAG: family 78 glycoside hydrolase catalytic domain [Rariglobus sp.]
MLVWITPRARRAATSAAPAVYLRGDFRLPALAAVDQATLRFTALGVVEPWINGQRVGADYFTPGWSDARKRAYSVDHDVTAQLRAGDNRWGFILADGWCGAPFGPKGHECTFAARTMLAAELVVRFTDGSEQRFATGSDWRARPSPTLAQSLYHGESHDARLARPDWCDAAAPNRGWSAVDVAPAPAIEITPRKCPPVRVTARLAPKRVWRDPRGRWLADFGQNISGVVEITIRGRAGQRVVLRFGEMLQADGTLYTENLRSARATDTYICAGRGSDSASDDGSETWHPHFTFHGFRYAEISGLTDTPKPADLRALVLHNDLARTGTFTTSNALVNRLQRCIVWGQRGNFLEAPTDCPQRDERLGWSGDAQVFVGTALFNYDCEGFYRQWMDAMRDGQRADGAFPDVAPDVLSWHGNAGWGDAGVIVPHAVWRNRGSTTIIEENYAAMTRFFAFLEARADRFIQPETVYGDWLSVDAAKPQWGPTPKDMIGTAYFAHDARLLSEMAAAIGRHADARRYAKLFNAIKRAFQKRFVTAEALVLGDTQTSYALALAFDLLPASARAAAGARLVAKIEARDWHLSTGFLGTPLLNPALSSVGRDDVAYRLLLQKTYPGWLYPIMNGATTMWERWNSWTRDGGFGPVEMNSFNHYAYGAVGEWLYQHVAGLSQAPESTGWSRVRIAPKPGGGLTHSAASYVAPQGVIRTAWRLTGRTLTVTATLPAGVSGTLHLPGRDQPVSIAAGEHRFTVRPYPAPAR